MEASTIAAIEGLTDWAAFDGLRTAPLRPPGSCTPSEYAEHYDLGLTTARDKLRVGVIEGKVQRVKVGNKSYYVPVKHGKKTK